MRREGTVGPSGSHPSRHQWPLAFFVRHGRVEKGVAGVELAACVLDLAPVDGGGPFLCEVEHADGNAIALAVQLRQHEAHCLGGADHRYLTSVTGTLT